MLSGQSEEQVVDERGELVTDEDPVLVEQVIGGDVGVWPTESLFQRIPLECGHHVMLWKAKDTVYNMTTKPLLLQHESGKR